MTSQPYSHHYIVLTYLGIPNIPPNAQWVKKGVTVVAGNGEGYEANQLSQPLGLFMDDEETMIIADNWNHRIVRWKKGDTDGTTIAGGQGQGNKLNQLKYPSDMVLDKQTKSLIICDRGNERVVQWSLRSGTTKGKVLIDNVLCFGLAIDDQRYLYVTNIVKHEVRKYKIGDKNGTIVAGGNGAGTDLNQLFEPNKLFIDQQQAVYITDSKNNRIVKWDKGAKAGVIVAGGHEQGDDLTQLTSPIGIVVDTLGTVYIADTFNNRVVSWPKGATEGTVIAGRRDPDEENDEFQYPTDISFDAHGNLYVLDWENSRVKRFSIKKPTRNN